MNDKSVGIVLIVAIIVFFFTSFGGNLVHDIAKYGIIIFGVYGGIKLIA